jgi:hypothetical protein
LRPSDAIADAAYQAYYTLADGKPIVEEIRILSCQIQRRSPFSRKGLRTWGQTIVDHEPDSIIGQCLGGALALGWIEGILAAK